MKGKKKKGNFIFDSVLALLLFAGVSLLLYPTFSNWWNASRQSQAISDYAGKVDEMDAEEYARLWREAWEYNRALAEQSTRYALTEEQKERYEKLLNVSGDGIMAYIEIPKISVDLPIRHGTSSAVLGSGVGHLYGTSLPVGGKSTNSVLAAHRGVPSAVLFTRLDELKKGDYFYIHVLGKTLAYKVDATWTVDPDDIRHYSITPGKDYVTLLTCTPYGVNTQRLLVRGTRVPLNEATMQSDHGIYPDLYIAVLLVVTVVIIGCGICVRMAAGRPVHASHARKR